MPLNSDDMEALNARLIEEMAAALGAEVDGSPFNPGKKSEPGKRPKWEPALGPTQQLIFRDNNEVVGACAEKFTGKSWTMLHKVTAHCYLEWDALFVIFGNSHRALSEGVCADLVNHTLPAWRDGNRAPPFDAATMRPNPKAGQLMDNGIGLEFTGWKMDPNNKDLYIKIRNKFGGYSRIRVIAIPYAKMVQSRVTNLNASGFYLEEATNCDGEEFSTFPIFQLNRRHGIIGPQQFLFTCNPESPENWVYKWMYDDVVVGKNEPGRVWANDPEKPGIRRDPTVSFYYLHYHENQHNVSQKNREQMKKRLRAKPTLRARLLESKWVAMPVGDALFKTEFVEARHVMGDAEKKKGLTPIPGHPIVVGLDCGSRNVGIVFKQIIETEDGPFDIAFDVLAFYQEMHKTRHLARAVLEKMRFWNEWLREERQWDEEAAPKGPDALPMGAPSWDWWFIAGDDATTNFNPESGNIHARDLEDHMQEILEEEPARYLGIDRPLIRGCPRPKDSVDMRGDIVAENLISDMAAVSAICTPIVGMFNHLPRDKDKPSAPAKGNRWIHIYDAYSYPNYYRRFMLPGGFHNFEPGAAIAVA